MDKIKILALGGLDEDGKDLYLIEINDDIYVIGGGFKYPSKATPGIDFIIADFTYLVENKDRVKAYILPKAKKNAFGAIPYIYKEVKAPIYCVKLTTIYLKQFTDDYHQENDYDFKILSLPSTVKINGLSFSFFSTCASMPSTFGFAIKTSLGNIVYSGDFIVEYSNEIAFRLDLNSLAKVAEDPTLILLSESKNSQKAGYCSPNHRMYNKFVTCFKEAQGRVFIALNSDNLYHLDEVFKACKDLDKKIYLFDNETKYIYDLVKTKDLNRYDSRNIVSKDDVLRVKDNELVIIMSDENERIYDKVSMFVNNEMDEKILQIKEDDTFYLAATPSDNNELVATSTIDELYKCGCKVKYETKQTVAKMHAYEEDLKMLLSLLKPTYYFPIEGYFVNLLANAQLAFEMGIGLSHNSIFLLDNGQSICFENGTAKMDFNLDEKIKVGDTMIDGIGVGDVVNEIISDRNRLGEDGVVVLGCAISKNERKIIAGPDVQMRGFLFLKDKDADVMLKEITNLFIDNINKWLSYTNEFDVIDLEETISNQIRKVLLKENNRNPVVKPNIVII